VTVASVYADWLQRGLGHLSAGRPINALLCFRRAIAAAPAAADVRFRLGEALWQLGLVDEAIHSFRDAAQADTRFVAPRMAVAEAELARGELAAAREAAAEALALAPGQLRAQAAHSVAAAALGDSAALATFAKALTAQPEIALLPAYAPALARALELAPRGAVHDGIVTQLLPALANLPSTLLAPVVGAALGHDRRALQDTLRARAWQRGEADALRRVIVAMYAAEPALARELAATHAAMCVAEPLQVPSLWPSRTGGAFLRVAWLMPAPDDAAFASACAVVRETQQQTAGMTATLTFVCAGNPGATRAALPGLPAEAAFLPLPPQPDATHARALAGRDPDVLIDLAGLRAATGPFLAARPARRIWSVAAVSPAHAPALVEAVHATAAELAGGLRALCERPFPEAPRATELAGWWDAAVRAHQQGDAAGAAAGYARVLAAQPGYAPAHRLLAVLARDGGDHEVAQSEFARALELAPDDADTRVAAAQFATTMHQPDRAAALLREGLDRTPYRVELWQALGHAELARRDGAAAAWAFNQALRLAPAGGQVYFNLGVALQMTGNADEAVQAYQRALVLRPDFASACFNLGVLFQQMGREEAAIAAYRQAAALNPRDAAAYKNLGEVLYASGRIDAWLANFRVFETNCPTSLSLAVQALEVSQLTGDHERLDRYLDGLRREKFPADDELALVDALEELLFLLLNFDVEAEMLHRFASTYDAAASRVYGTPRLRPHPRRPGKVRLGYLSGDLRDHVMGKQIWQAIQHHDREKFELFFYATTAARDAWTEKFAGIADRFDVVANLHDADAADLIDGDDLDLLVDLSTHTKGARPGILALKPARVQITHVASCGTVGLRAIDYKLTDHFADLPENQEFMLETLLPMEGCVYPWRSVAPAIAHPFTRSALGIAPDTFVIGAFVSPLKLSRRCLALWRDILERVPRAKLAFSPNNAAQRPLYLRIAAAAGIASDRVLFLPQGRDESENQARYALVDAVLDTLPYGGVNGTMEALAMGVPVVTLVGKRHGERSAYSILANLGVLATVAQGGREFVDIAVRLATDPAFMAEVHDAIRGGLERSVLTDMVAHTRNLEAAYLRAMAERAT
jgi:protein O-GlcNAc transferase